MDSACPCFCCSFTYCPWGLSFSSVLGTESAGIPIFKVDNMPSLCPSHACHLSLLVPISLDICVYQFICQIPLWVSCIQSAAWQASLLSNIVISPTCAIHLYFQGLSLFILHFVDWHFSFENSLQIEPALAGRVRCANFKIILSWLK